MILTLPRGFAGGAAEFGSALTGSEILTLLRASLGGGFIYLSPVLTVLPSGETGLLRSACKHSVQRSIPKKYSQDSSARQMFLPIRLLHVKSSLLELCAALPSEPHASNGGDGAWECPQITRIDQIHPGQIRLL